MAQADANRTSIFYVKETTWGATPAVSTLNVTQTRITGTTLQHNKQTVLSEELRADRARADYMEVGVNAQGDFNFELTIDDMLQLFEGLAQSTFVLSSTAQSFVYAASTITGADGWTNNLAVGQWIRVSAVSNVATNNQKYRVTAKSSTVATLDIGGAGALVVTTLAASVTGKRLRNGITETSFVILQKHEDISQVAYFNGMEVNQLQLNVASQAVTNGTFSFIGKTGFFEGSASTPVSSIATSATTNTPVNATSNIGQLRENAASLSTPLRSIQFTINNNLASRNAIANKPAIGIRSGTCDISGTIEAYFEDQTLLTKFLNHTATSILFTFNNPTDGKSMIWTFPRIFYGAGSPTAPGINQDVMLNLDFTAVLDSTTSCMWQVDLI